MSGSAISASAAHAKDKTATYLENLTWWLQTDEQVAATWAKPGSTDDGCDVER